MYLLLSINGNSYFYFIIVA